MSPESIGLHGKVTATDLRKFQSFHVFRRAWPIGVVCILIVLFWLLMLSFGITSGGNLHGFLTNTTPFLLLLLLWCSMILFRPYWAAYKQLKTQSYLLEPVAYTFTGEKLMATGANASWEMKWAIVQRVFETKSLFIIYHARNLAMIVPKHFFQSSTDVKFWKELVENSIPNKKIEGPGVIGRFC